MITFLWLLLPLVLIFVGYSCSKILGIYAGWRVGNSGAKDSLWGLGVVLTSALAILEFIFIFEDIADNTVGEHSISSWLVALFWNVAGPLLVLLAAYIIGKIWPMFTACFKAFEHYLEGKSGSNQKNKNAAAPPSANTSAAPGKKKRSLGPRWR